MVHYIINAIYIAKGSYPSPVHDDETFLAAPLHSSAIDYMNAI